MPEENDVRRVQCRYAPRTAAGGWEGRKRFRRRAVSVCEAGVLFASRFDRALDGSAPGCKVGPPRGGRSFAGGRPRGCGGSDRHCSFAPCEKRWRIFAGPSPSARSGYAKLPAIAAAHRCRASRRGEKNGRGRGKSPAALLSSINLQSSSYSIALRSSRHVWMTPAARPF
jgi:hypothetical protein